VMALKVNYAGELGWELHHPIEFQRSLYEALIAEGKDLGLANIGMLAYNSLRLEKGYCGSSELDGERTPFEASMERFVYFDKEDFIGKKALLDGKKKLAPEKKLVLLQIDNDEADALGDEPLIIDEEVVGRVTSGGYGHRTDTSLAFGYINSQCAVPGTAVKVEILGKISEAVTVEFPFYDPQNTRPKG